MYVIIVGGGRLGFYLAKGLLSEGHEILVIEKNRVKVERIEEELGSICMQGDGCEAATLTQAGTERASLFIAVTDEDDDNLVSCQVARHMFAVPRVIARISNPKNEILFKKLGIDVTVSGTSLIMEHITEEVPTHPLVHLMEIKETNTKIVEVKVSPGSPAIGKQIKDLALPRENMLTLIIRDRKVIVPTQNTVIQAEDRAIAVTSADTERALCAELCGI